MNAVVTGGTGFLGRSLLRELVKQGHAVRALARRPEDHARVRVLGAEPIAGDLSEFEGCGDLVGRGDVVFHAAARVGMAGTWAAFREATVESTRRLLAHALPRGPSRVVYVSSAVVYAPPGDGSPMSAEWTPARPAHYNLYARAKLQAERIVRAECDRAKCPWVIVRLGFLHGPGNRALAMHLRRLGERNHLFVIGPGDNRIATVYVDDAARAVVLAGARCDAVACIYDVASDELVTQRAFLEASAEALGLPRPQRRMPRFAACAAATLGDMIARVCGFELPFSRAMVTLMSADQVVDATRIREELGWRPEVSFAEGVRRTREWYRRRGQAPLSH